VQSAIEKRIHQRIEAAAPIAIQFPAIKDPHNGMMFNYSRKGIYLETNVNCRPGQDVVILVENPPYASNPCIHRAEIMWSKEMSDAVVFYHYAAGARLDHAIDLPLDHLNLIEKKRSGVDRRNGQDRRSNPDDRRK
jgi:hypothetical protein